jgi:hypothetical protein
LIDLNTTNALTRPTPGDQACRILLATTVARADNHFSMMPHPA